MDNVQYLFKQYDKDDSGYIELNKIKQIADKLQIPNQFNVILINQISQINVNGDGKISYRQFKNWYYFAKSGRMLFQLYKFKLLALKKLIQYQSILKDKNIHFQVFIINQQKLKQDIRQHVIELKLGQKQIKAQINFQIIYNNPIKKQKIIILKQIPMKNNLNIILQLHSIYPQQIQNVNQNFNSFIEYLKNLDIEQLNQALQLIQFQIHIKQSHLYLQINLNPQLQQALLTHQIIDNIIQKLGQQFSLLIQFKLGFLEAFQKAMKQMKLVKYIFSGFRLFSKLCTNSTLLKKLQTYLYEYQKEFLQEKSMFNFLTKLAMQNQIIRMLKSSKTRIQFKNVDDIEKCFANLGLEQLAQDQPTLTQIVQQLSQQYKLYQWRKQNQKFHPIFKLVQFLKNHCQNCFKIYIITQLFFLKSQMNLPNASSYIDLIFGFENKENNNNQKKFEDDSFSSKQLIPIQEQQQSKVNLLTQLLKEKQKQNFDEEKIENEEDEQIQ